jgi:hypothetical protein
LFERLLVAAGTSWHGEHLKKKEFDMKNIRIKAIVLVFFMIIGFGSGFAGEVTFFGPKQYTRDKGKPITIEENFTIPLNYASPGFTMTLTNGSAPGKNRVSSAEIELNGELIFSSADFNHRVGLMERTVELKTGNLLSINKPGTVLANVRMLHCCRDCLIMDT